MGKVFKAFTNQGLEFKVLFDIQFDAVEMIVLVIGIMGISSSSICEGSGLGTSFLLRSNEFNDYMINEEYFTDDDTVIYACVSTEDIYNALKSVKKGNHISVYIDEEENNILKFKISWNGTSTITGVNIITPEDGIESIIWEEPQGYSEISSFMVSCTEFQKAFKQMTDANTKITVRFQNNGIRLFAGSKGFLNKNHILGRYNKDKYASDICVYEYPGKNIGRTIKMNSLKNNIKFFINPDLYLRLVTSVGTLGYVKIFLIDYQDISVPSISIES